MKFLPILALALLFLSSCEWSDPNPYIKDGQLIKNELGVTLTPTPIPFRGAMISMSNNVIIVDNAENIGYLKMHYPCIIDGFCFPAGSKIAGTGVETTDGKEFKRSVSPDGTMVYVEGQDPEKASLLLGIRLLLGALVIGLCIHIAFYVLPWLFG